MTPRGLPSTFDSNVIRSTDELRTRLETTMTSFQAEVSLGRIEPALRQAYPVAIANRIDARLRYDLLFIEEAGGAVALESEAGLLPAVVAAVERAGLTCGKSLQAVEARQLPLQVARILSVNPTGGEIARLRELARTA
jgi:hypothetical protein